MRSVQLSVSWDKCGIFGESVNDDQDGLHFSYLGEVCDEV